ncbi:MAG: ABC-F family ATP-binding cassette domain-containing protein [Candidatus Kapaibacterium sp.]|nr:ABC-F family ATP-binding cassette domain-containing protein [Ignavibacteriota bacterium]MCB9220297.1 ABC-F family ATP-binding cassette domain-containing protein [Ignavibacteria bacterium]
MINVSNLTLSFGGRTLLDEITFVLNPKERVGLIGRNGQGKSTLLKILIGLTTPNEGNISHPKDYEIGYLPQEGGAKSDLTLFDEVKKAFAAQNQLTERIDRITNEIGNRNDYHTDDYNNLIIKLAELNDHLNILDSGSIEAKIERVLIGLGFKRDEFEKYCNQFSGGWQMRIELAKILLSKPDLILLDEPTNHLDIESIMWLESFLKDYYGAVVIVSHDKRFLNNVTNRTIEIFNGKIFDKKFSYSRFIEERKADIELQKKAQINQERHIKSVEQYVERYRAKARHASRAQSKLKQLDKLDKIEIDDFEDKRIKFKFPEPPRSAKLVVETKGIQKSFGHKHVLKGVDFALERGEKVSFIGKNGTGKSTLTKIITEHIDYDLGELKFGSNVKLGYFRQDQSQLLNEELTVLDTIANVANEDIRPYVRDLLGAFLFSGDDVQKKVKVLSGGERARLSIARLLLEPTNFLVMDEPTNHLDISSKEILKDALKSFSGALILVSHDRDFLQGITDRTIEFTEQGTKEYLGDIDYYLDKREFSDITEIDLEKVPKNNNDCYEKEKSDSQQKRLKLKELEKTKRKIEREISETENNISDFEEKMNDLDEGFSNPDIYNDPERVSNLKIEYSQLETKLNESMEKWTELNTKLDETLSEISIHQT